MPARHRSLILAVAAWIAALVAVSACSTAPSPPTDPRQILDAAVTHLRAARSVHLEASVDGTMALDGLLGGVPQASGRGLGLTGTHLDGDADLAGQRAAIRFQVPALLGLEGEVRQLGPDAYLESSLTSRGWHRITGVDLPIAIGHPIEWLTALTAWLDRPSVVPVRLDDASCRSGTCYVVRVAPDQGDIEALSSAAPGLAAGLAGATISVELRIERTSLVLSEAVFHIDLGGRGNLTVSSVFSAWDEGVDVEPPPSSDVVSGPLLP